LAEELSAHLWNLFNRLYALSNMRRIYFLFAWASAIGITASASVGLSTDGSAKPSPRLAGRTPVLVELFTSEGCSSCPLADTLLAKLQANQPVDDALIIPLSEHVDYWDNERWRDRFSSPLFSTRQASYVQALQENEVYTPQMVVDGQKGFVGSEEKTAIAAIAASAKQPKATVELVVTSHREGSVGLTISISGLAARQPAEPDSVFVAVTENNLSNQVQGGENEGRRLSHQAVVRTFTKVGFAKQGAKTELQSVLHLDLSWKRNDLAIVAFVQGQVSGRILGSGEVTVE
jgi:hypothetical protein